MARHASRIRIPLNRLLLLLMVAGVTRLAQALCSDALARATDWRQGGGSWQDVPAEVAVPALAAVILTACTVWLLLITVAVAVEVLTGRSVSALRRLTPESLRRLVTTGLGVAVSGAAVLAPASAAPEPCPGQPAGPACVSSLDGLALPDRPVGLLSTPGTTHQVAARARPAPGTHVVEKGDSLWRIAAGRLPATATTVEVDRAWRRLYRANRDRVGDDPDLLRVGVQLRVPRLLPASTSGRPDGSGPARDKEQS